MIRFEAQNVPAGRLQYFVFDGDEKIGEAWFKLREYDKTIVISNIEILKPRQGIGTKLIERLMGEYPGYRFRGENPNGAAVEWHKHLESSFGDRMIPFSTEELKYALDY